MITAEETARMIFDKIANDLPLKSGDEVSVMLNGLGATPLEELFIVYGYLDKILIEHGIKVFMPHIGEFATSMEMAGLSATIIKLDEQLKKLLSVPAITPLYTNINK